MVTITKGSWFDTIGFTLEEVDKVVDVFGQFGADTSYYHEFDKKNTIKSRYISWNLSDKVVGRHRHQLDPDKKIPLAVVMSIINDSFSGLPGLPEVGAKCLVNTIKTIKEGEWVTGTCIAHVDDPDDGKMAIVQHGEDWGAYDGDDIKTMYEASSEVKRFLDRKLKGNDKTIPEVLVEAGFNPPKE